MLTEVIDGGVGPPDFLLVGPSNSWADLGKQMDSTVLKMRDGVHGKTDTAAVRKTIRDSVQDSSTHIDRYREKLSCRPAGK
jgi:hypothetical protein